jgi:hypothetical protein
VTAEQGLESRVRAERLPSAVRVDVVHGFAFLVRFFQFCYSCTIYQACLPKTLFAPGRALEWVHRRIAGSQFRSYIPTPPFASYISGHSTFSASAAEILERFTGSDAFGGSFTALPGSSGIEPGLTPAQTVTLSWNTFSDAADQAGLSRRLGGIHFLADDLVGRATGRLVAEAVWTRTQSYINGTDK